MRLETVYEGEWDSYQWHGVGTWRSPDGSGDIYHGQFDHGKKSGTGRMLFGDSSQGGGSYVGEWKDDAFHGRGVRLWANGDRYDGQWVDGVENGEGTKTWSKDGSSFTGLWEMGTQIKGMRRWPNGDWFEGKFTQESGGSNGWECHGVGVLTLSSAAGCGAWTGTLNNNLFQTERQEEELQKHKDNTISIQKAHPELKEALDWAKLFQSQLEMSAQEFTILQKSLEKLNQRLQGATESKALASHLRELTELKAKLVKKVNESVDACKNLLGQSLSVQSSEAEIQECSRNISTLTKKVCGMKGLSSKDDNVVEAEECDELAVNEALLHPLAVPEQPQCDTFAPPFQLLCQLSETLAHLQKCQFDECTKLADKHTVLSKELCEQVSLVGTLHKAIEETQRECSELWHEYKGKWKLQRGLEGDEKFIGLPDVWPHRRQVKSFQVLFLFSSEQYYEPPSTTVANDNNRNHSPRMHFHIIVPSTSFFSGHQQVQHLHGM
ncbi:hypothetical protein Pelo_7859 [Pelomyxa schiedti]|nr:hypothetical protein Pelo_7859 [Pelomyxa schiedti]